MQKRKKGLLFVPPLLIAGILVVLLPIFTFMTMERLERQNEFINQKMVEAGMALIRTFEAGTRTGMITMRWGAQKIQAMLQETAADPEVEYVLIVSADGRILAHSDPGQVGGLFEHMPQIKTEKNGPFNVNHRVVENTDAPPVFEVYKRFAPVKKRFGRKHFMKMQMAEQRTDGERFPAEPGSKDWSRHYLEHGGKPDIKMEEHYIFAGLSMTKAEVLKTRMVKKTVFGSVILFLLGCAGILALFAFQAYRSAKASLSSVKAFSDTVIQNMPSGLVTLDRDQRITSMNHEARQMFGDDLTRPFPEWVELIGQLDGQPSIVSREMNLEPQNRKRMRLEVIASVIREKGSETGGYLFLLRDLSQVRELQNQVETNKRLAAIGKLAAGVAHEIRNPLSSIKGLATYFSKRYHDNEADVRTAEIMIGEVERINRSITQLLEFAKPMAVNKRGVDLKEMIDHSLRLVQPDLDQKEIKSRVDISTQKKEIFTDPDRMNQVFLNLFINAIDALDEQGRLEVSVKDSADGDRMEFRVTDNGRGMDEESVLRIFDPYYTTRPTGTGLGLSIVHRIIENLNGQIRVDSQKGKGTCFTIILPVDRPEPGRGASL